MANKLKNKMNYPTFEEINRQLEPLNQVLKTYHRMGYDKGFKDGCQVGFEKALDNLRKGKLDADLDLSKELELPEETEALMIHDWPKAEKELEKMERMFEVIEKVVKKAKAEGKKTISFNVKEQMKWYCGECGEIREDDARVENDMKCGRCAYGY